MAGQFSKTDQRRITFLSLLSSAVNWEGSDVLPYQQATEWLSDMESDGFFEEERGSSRPTQAPSGRSDRPASRTQSSRSSDKKPFSGNYRNPDAPASEKQVKLAVRLQDELDLEDPYSVDELTEMKMPEIGDLISDLNRQLGRE